MCTGLFVVSIYIYIYIDYRSIDRSIVDIWKKKSEGSSPTTAVLYRLSTINKWSIAYI